MQITAIMVHKQKKNFKILKESVGIKIKYVLYQCVICQFQTFWEWGNTAIFSFLKIPIAHAYRHEIENS